MPVSTFWISSTGSSEEGPRCHCKGQRQSQTNKSARDTQISVAVLDPKRTFQCSFTGGYLLFEFGNICGNSELESG